MNARTIVAGFKRALASFSSSEHGPVLNRVTIGVAVSLYMISPWFEGDGQYAGQVRAIAFAYMTVAVVLLLSIYPVPGVSHVRRVVGLVADVAAVSTVLYFTGVSALPLIAVYLWVIVGFGFRYGVRYLALATGLSLAGFSLMVRYSEFWHQHTGFGATIMLLLLLIPFYSGLLISRLHEAIREAKEASQAKSRFVANMSHELRTPLNGVIGMADLMYETQLNRRQREIAHGIQTSAGVLLGVIENVLDFSRIEAGKVVIERGDFDLYRMLSDTVNLFAHQARKKGLKFAMHIDPRTPFMLVGDAFHLRQVLINLLGNAIKFTSSGRVELRVSSVGEAAGEIRVRFEVEDTGIGIAAQDQQKLFESFQQLDASTTRRYGGSGLGTAIARQLVQLMGGDIGLQSEPGMGSVFWFEVPLQLQEGGGVSLDERLDDGRALLLTSESLRAELEPQLQQWNLDTSVCESPARAFARLVEASEAGQAFTVVLVEQTKLDVDASQFARVVRGEPLLDRVSLVLLQAPWQDEEHQLMAAGYSSVLKAPADSRLLFNALHAAWAEHELPANVVSLTEHYEQQLAGQARPLRILVAEDNKTNQQVLQGILEGTGHEVQLAANGRDALDMIEASEQSFDLMIFDMNMPVMGGLEAMKTMRFMESPRHVPVIILTADATEEALQRCRNEGADDFLTKPVESRRLLESIARLISESGIGEVAKARSKDAGRGETGTDKQAQDSLVDQRVLKSLLRLGSGMTFFEELVDGFTKDVESLLVTMRQALSEQDYPALQDAAHALRGSASELGVQRLVELCIEIKALKPYEMGTRAPAKLLQEIEAGFASSRIILDDFIRQRRVASAKAPHQERS